jgi:hypothetical protein
LASSTVKVQKGDKMPNSPVKFNIEYPEKLSRGTLLLRLFFGWAYVGIPHGIVLALYSVAVYIVIIIAWFAVLFTGTYPKGMFDFVVKFMRWGQRVGAYMLFMTDAYPPFNGNEDTGAAPPPKV